MISDTLIITSSAASLGFFHTILGPDHYLPFVAMARTNGWSGYKTAGYVALCGVSHVLGTILIGLLTLGLGFALFKIENFQSIRGNFAGWFLLFLGAIYFVWGINLALKERGNSTSSNQLNNPKRKFSNSYFIRSSPFLLFLFFILGPCEPLLPLLALGSENTQYFSSFLVIMAFCLTTILTMLLCVMLFYYGFSRFSIFMKYENFMHAITGFVIFACGFSIQFFGT
jgi:sulfite exporter TauE/SafE